MKNIIIGGTSLIGNHKAGVARVVEETLRALDRNQEWVDKFEITVVSPVEIDTELHYVKKVVYNPFHRKQTKIGIELWNQIDLVRYVKKNRGLLIDMSSECPLACNDISFIYDCQPEHFRDNYITGWYSGFVNKVKLFKRRRAVHRAVLIVTDSEHAKADIAATFHVQQDKIVVIFPGWQHFKSVKEDDSIFGELTGVTKKQYYFSLGSGYKHKNIRWVIEAARQNPDKTFVITGNYQAAQYSDWLTDGAPENVIFTGYLTDEKVKALLRNCEAFIQPSLSEGFGIPPLEALSLGVPVIVSDSSCMPEIYGACAHYIDPLQYDGIDIDAIMQTPVETPDCLLEKYSWEKAASKLLKCVEKLCQE